MTFRGRDPNATRFKRLDDGGLGATSNSPAAISQDGIGRTNRPKDLGDAEYEEFWQTRDGGGSTGEGTSHIWPFDKGKGLITRVRVDLTGVSSTNMTVLVRVNGITQATITVPADNLVHIEEGLAIVVNFDDKIQVRISNAGNGANGFNLRMKVQETT